MRKKLLILPIIAIVVAVFSTTVLAVNGSQQNWVKVYSGSTDITDMFDISEITVPSTFTYTSQCSGVEDKVKAIDSNLKIDDFKGVVGYEIKALASATLPSGPYKVEVQNAVASNEVYIFVHADGSYEFAVAKGGKPTVTVDTFSPFYVYTATSQTSPQTGDFAPAYIAMISVALISCGAIFAIRAKKATKVTK